MGKLTLFLVFILGWLQYSLWLGKNGVRDFVRVQDDIELQQVYNDGLKTRNNQLIAEIENLGGGLDAIEERARNELGMIKPGERFYRIVSESPTNNVKP